MSSEVASNPGVAPDRVRVLEKMNSRKEGRSRSETHLTTSDVARLLNVHPNTVRRWSKLGLLKTYRVGPRGDRRFRRSDVQSLIKENKR